jgi:hypothetical protein
MEEEKNNIEASVNHLEEYLQARYELLKLRVLERTAMFGGALLSSLVTFFALTLFILFGSVAAALAIGEYTGYRYLGFICIAGLYLLLYFVMRIRRTRLLRGGLMNFMIRKLFERFDK